MGKQVTIRTVDGGVYTGSIAELDENWIELTGYYYHSSRPEIIEGLAKGGKPVFHIQTCHIVSEGWEQNKPAKPKNPFKGMFDKPDGPQT